MTLTERNSYREKYFYEKRKPFIIDQCAFQVPPGIIDRDNFDFYEKGKIITARNESGKLYVHFHDSAFRNNHGILNCIFMAIQNNYYENYPLFNRDISLGFIYKHFKLRVIEFAFDFYTNFTPLFINFDTGSFRKVDFKDKTTTVYSSDYTVYDSKTIDSMFSWYNRHAKLLKYEEGIIDKTPWVNSICVKDKIFRFEYRLKDYNIYKIKTEDLIQTPLGLSRKVKPILVMLTKKTLEPNSVWPVNSEFVKFLHPYLYEILKESNQVAIKSFANHEYQALRKHFRGYKYSS